MSPALNLIGDILVIAAIVVTVLFTGLCLSGLLDQMREARTQASRPAPVIPLPPRLRVVRCEPEQEWVAPVVSIYSRGDGETAA